MRSSSSSGVWNQKKKKKRKKKKKKKEIDLWELAEKPLTSCCICININQAIETIWWTIEGALGVMWFDVCWSAPQSRAGLLDRPHLNISTLKRPTPVRSLLSLIQTCRGRSDPGQYLNVETIYSRCLLVGGCHSADHILAMQWAFVSLCRAVDRSISLVAKRRRDFSLGCVSTLVMVWWRRVHGTAGQSQTCCSPTKLCWWNACKHRELLYWCRL